MTRAEYKKEWRENNRDKIVRHRKRYYNKNREVLNAISRKYHASHREKMRDNVKRWGQNNRHKLTAKWARRRAAKLHATPKWANQFFIEEIYHLSLLRTEALGIPCHVDHIVPLIGTVVCGLHVEYNLQVITATENYTKGNKLLRDHQWY